MGNPDKEMLHPRPPEGLNGADANLSSHNHEFPNVKIYAKFHHH